MLWGRQVLLAYLETKGANMSWAKHLGTPLLTPGSGCRGARVCICWLSSPLKAVGLWPCSFLSSSLRLETSPPHQALTKSPLTLSPSDFPSRGFKELGSTGGRER